LTVNLGKDLANSLGIKFLETSAKEAVNVEKAFVTLSGEIRSKVKPRGPAATGDAGKGGKTIVRGLDQKQDQKKAGCC